MQAQERSRITFEEYAEEYKEWRRVNRPRSWRTDRGRFPVLVASLGEKRLDEITSLDIERFRDSLLERDRPLCRTTANRYRDLLSAMFKRAIRPPR